jgi:NAD(P)-dependent dehydrogenase (short-subunit alcohol dehydrogenase family)
MRVVVADINLHPAEETAQLVGSAGGTAVAVQLDVSSREENVALAERIAADFDGPPDVLALNAGVMAPSPLLEAEEAGWRWLVEVNLFGVLYGVQTFVPRMLATGRPGHVVITASSGGMAAHAPHDGNRIVLGAGEPSDHGQSNGYGVVKHAVVALAEFLSGDLAGTPVGVSVLCPGHHATGIYENSALHRPDAYGGPMSGQTLAAVQHISEMTDSFASAMPEGTKSPDEAADRVVRAIREGHFWVFTHPQWRAPIDQRYAQVCAGFDDAVSFPAG